MVLVKVLKNYIIQFDISGNVIHTNCTNCAETGSGTRNFFEDIDAVYK